MYYVKMYGFQQTPPRVMLSNLLNNPGDGLTFSYLVLTDLTA